MTDTTTPGAARQTEQSGQTEPTRTESANSANSNAAAPDVQRQGLKLALEVGPLVIFFVMNAQAGIFYATGAFMVATLISLTASRMIFKKIPLMPLITGIFVIFFGALTLLLQDETFIKMKPTITNVLFGSILLGCLAANLLVWKYLFADAFALDDEGWRKLQFRWGSFFLFLAVLNEIVWRNYSTDFWVNFKVFGLMPLTIVFSLTLIPVLMKHSLEETDDSAGA